MKVRISTKLLKSFLWASMGLAAVFGIKNLFDLGERSADARILETKKNLARVEKIVYQSSQPPTDRDMLWLADEDRHADREFGESPILYQNLDMVCYRDGKLQVEWIDPRLGKEQYYFTDVDASWTRIILNADGNFGWLIYDRRVDSWENHSSIYAITLHLPRDYHLETCK